MRSECGLKNERFGGFLGVAQGALKNTDFVKEVEGNLRAGSRAGQSALDGCEWLEAGFMFLCSSVCLMKRK